jgi:hypothetical protein
MCMSGYTRSVFNISLPYALSDASLHTVWTLVGLGRDGRCTAQAV